jgi:hypothetical protein
MALSRACAYWPAMNAREPPSDAASCCVTTISSRDPTRSSDEPAVSVTVTVGSEIVRSRTASWTRCAMRSARNRAVYGPTPVVIQMIGSPPTSTGTACPRSASGSGGAVAACCGGALAVLGCAAPAAAAGPHSTDISVARTSRRMCEARAVTFGGASSPAVAPAIAQVTR